MSDDSFNIVLTGELGGGTSHAEATAAFAKLFKIDIGKAEAVFAKTPCAVKKNVDEASAKKYVGAIKKINVGVKMVPVNVQTPADAQSQNSETAPTHVQETSLVVDKIENFKGYAFSIDGRPDYSFLTVQIPANETLKVEASAMATMDTHIKMKTKLKGGFSRFLTGESLFLNEYTAESVPGEMGIAPGAPGDLVHQHLDGNTLFLQNSAYVASTMGVNVESKWQGMLKGFFSGENLFLIRCSGDGDLWFNSYGAIIEIDVTGDYVVDTGNIVAFTDGLDYKISKVGGYKSLFFSGEGFVCRFSGQGKVWIQTRSAQAFTLWAHFFRPLKSRK